MSPAAVAHPQPTTPDPCCSWTPSKRRKTVAFVDVEGSLDPSSAVPPHPLGLKPSGNAYTSSLNAKEAAGRFSTLEDETLLLVLEYLDSRSLLRLGATCRALYAFCTFDDLWKNIYLRYVFAPACFAPLSPETSICGLFIPESCNCSALMS